MTKLTAEKCREQFEEWIKSKGGDNEYVLLKVGPKKDTYHHTAIQAAWQSWQASREALEIALPVLEQQSGWVSCSERMPEFGRYLVIYESEVGRGMVTAQYMQHNFCAGSDNIHCLWLDDRSRSMTAMRGVTHWQPLPAPPQPTTDTTDTTDTNRQIENDDWIEWRGGKRPVDSMAIVETMCRNGACAPPEVAVYWEWAHNNSDLDIIAYRVIENDGREG